MSNENSNLRVGSAGAGLFVGSTEITGGGNAENIFDLNGNLMGDNITIILLNNSNEAKSITFNTSRISREHTVQSNSTLLIKGSQEYVNVIANTSFSSFCYYMLANDDGEFVQYGAGISRNINAGETISDTGSLGSEGALWVYLITN